MNEKKKTNMALLEYWSKVVAIVVALITAVIGVYQLSLNVSQNRRDLEWKKADLARQMINNMLDDSGWQAMEMLDYEDAGQVFTSDRDEEIVINAKDVYAALDITKTDFTHKDVFIKYRFDRLFFLVSQLERAVQSELVDFEEVSFPLSWYAKHKMCPQKKLFESYMTEFAAPETIEFFERLDEWNDKEKCASQQ